MKGEKSIKLATLGKLILHEVPIRSFHLSRFTSHSNNVRFEREYKKIMAAQQSLFNISDYGKVQKKRVRYKKPTYIKSYQFRVFNEDTGQLQYYGDEKHILRIKTLHKLYSMIYGYCGVGLFEVFEKKIITTYCPTALLPYCLIIWGEDKQAEIAGTWSLPLKERVLLHLRLLRYLRKGLSIQESLRLILK